MPTNRETLLCGYNYDPLDRLVDSTFPVTEQATIQRFYQKDRLATEVQGVVQRSIMQHNDQLLGQQQRQTGTVTTRLLTTDQQRSVLSVLDATRSNHLAYTAYGHRSPENGLLSLLGFNGEPPDPVTGCYVLGNGYRAFNPVLMRFNRPDSWSPFGKGGLNAYAYCAGDPVNRLDPTGHAGIFGALKFIGRKLGFRKSSRVVPEAGSTSSTYADVGSTLNQGSVSSGYASINSYSSVSGTPRLPMRSPPGSIAQDSVSTIGPSASVRSRNPNYAKIAPDVTLSELPEQHPKLAAREWAGSIQNVTDEQLAEFVQIPRPGAGIHSEERLAVHARGMALETKRMKKFQSDYQWVGYMNNKGEMSARWERTKIRRT
ncbi:RHS repeat-associated core domain-containing protein [Pseudomonas violetae]|jgi:RHS repeat-associated protein|uniref:RHS repeat-associated core domain-containing protein n=1 Tax=Pseudomonas violetae TaxID=2915813 RepID=A0ABT0F364_9PSED|nr:RHS repeat-associated core domain-containing protein [Pseudomonas violetae]MCK1792418.1 RHS repeat-associated core domain-containing protein [Pseudomonas violetae]